MGMYSANKKMQKIIVGKRKPTQKMDSKMMRRMKGRVFKTKNVNINKRFRV